MRSKLEIYQERVEHLGTMVSRIGDPTCHLGAPKIFEVKGGEAKVWILHERESVSIAKAYLSPGAQFPVHAHGARETIILYEGQAIYRSGAKIKILTPGSCVGVPAGKPHRVTAGPDGAWFSITTVPREEGLGDAR